MPAGNKKGTGRLKGCTNLLSRPLKEWLSEHMNTPEERVLFVEDWISLEPRDRMNMRAKFYDFLIPKPAAQASDTTDTSKSYTVVWS